MQKFIANIFNSGFIENRGFSKLKSTLNRNCNKIEKKKQLRDLAALSKVIIAYHLQDDNG